MLLRQVSKFRRVKPAIQIAVIIVITALIGVVALAQGIATGSPPRSGNHIIELQFVEYREYGVTVRYGATAYLRNGQETIISETYPGHPFRTLVRRGIDAIESTFQLSREVLGLAEAPHAVADYARRECSNGSRPVIARERILNFDTVAVQGTSATSRFTYWNAPALGCIRCASSGRSTALMVVGHHV